MISCPINPKHRKLMLALFIIIAILGLTLLMNYGQKPEKQGSSAVCTKEAKICPDGSAAGRQGPDCEFASCPESSDEINYISELPTDYIGIVTWPPHIQLSAEKFNCQASSSQEGSPQAVAERVINGNDYCIASSSAKTAGSVYYDYRYSTEVGNELVTAYFSLRLPVCENYDELEMNDCQKEQGRLNVDRLADDFISNMK